MKPETAYEFAKTLASILEKYKDKVKRVEFVWESLVEVHKYCDEKYDEVLAVIGRVSVMRSRRQPPGTIYRWPAIDRYQIVDGAVIVYKHDAYDPTRPIIVVYYYYRNT